MPFRNPLALLGLLSIIPLVILYLIRPRPRDVPFSSTLFLPEGEAKRSAVLSRLITDPLFWIQLLIIISLTAAASGYYTADRGEPSSHMVLVMDLSASMEGGFEDAVDLAGSRAADYDRVSIILAESIPISALQEGSAAEAQDVLERLRTRDVSADLSAAMILADGFIGPEGGNILVISDFRSWSGDDPEATRNIIEAEGDVGVVFAPVSRGGENVGIIGGWNVEAAGFINHTAQIHNFGSAREVPVTISTGAGESSRTVPLARGEDYYLSFTAAPGVTAVSLDIDDGMDADDHAYVFVPEREPVDVLYRGDAGPALAALTSLPNARVSRSGDPQAFDVVVVAPNSSTDGELNRYVTGGGNVIYIAQDWNESPEYLPVRIQGIEEGPANLWVRDEGFTEGIHFEEIGVYHYIEAEARRRSVTMIEADGEPLLAYWRLGRGTAIYNGLDVDSDFYMRPEYPIFWYQAINWLAGVPAASDLNRETGEVIPLGEVATVDTPAGSVTTSSLLLDEAGIYSFQGRALAANMYDPDESELGPSASFPTGVFAGESGIETIVENDFSPWLIALAAVAILAEIILTRRRREA